MTTSNEIYDWARQEHSTLKQNLKKGDALRLIQGDDTADPVWILRLAYSPPDLIKYEGYDSKNRFCVGILLPHQVRFKFGVEKQKTKEQPREMGFAGIIKHSST